MYLSIYVYIYLYIYVYMYRYMCIYIYIYVYMAKLTQASVLIAIEGPLQPIEERDGKIASPSLSLSLSLSIPIALSRRGISSLQSISRLALRGGRYSIV